VMVGACVCGVVLCGFNSNVLIKYSREFFRWSTCVGSAFDRIYLFRVNMGQLSIYFGVEKLK